MCKISYYVVLISIVAFACKKNDTDSSDNNQNDKGLQIYILGHTGDSLVLWKNDTLNLINRNFNGQYEDKQGQLQIENNDIFIAGSENYKSVLYKNGVKTILHPVNSRATTLFVQNNNTYVGGLTMDINGTITGSSYSAYWNNGIKNIYYGANSICNSIFRDGNDTYLTGASGLSTGYDSRSIVFFKNNIPIVLTSDASEGMGIAKNGNDIIVAGNVYTYNASYAVVWINGVQSYVENTPSSDMSRAFNIYVKDGDVYITGTKNGLPAYWKNGQAVILDPHTAGAARDIKVLGNDIYVVGDHYNVFSRRTVAILWKNGTGKELYGENFSCAFSIAVK